MNKDLFASLLAYKSIMAQAKVLLRQGTITKKEYTHFDTIEVTTALVAAAVKENATLPQSQDAYREKFAALEKRFSEQKNKRAVLEAKIEERKARAHDLDLFMDTLAERDLLLERRQQLHRQADKRRQARPPPQTTRRILPPQTERRQQQAQLHWRQRTAATSSSSCLPFRSDKGERT